jgi:hypothetical protein
LPSAKGEHEGQPPDTVLEFLTGATLELLRTREADLAIRLSGSSRAELSQFLFQCLYFVNPLGCRRLAAEALGYLSKSSSQEATVLMFTKELNACKEWKEFVSYQRGVREACKFNLDSTLISFLNSMIQFESKDSTLFMAMAQTIIDVMMDNRAATAIPAIKDDEL